MIVRMRRLGRPVEVPVGRAIRIDYGLSPEVPVFLGSSTYPRETPLATDFHEGVEVGVLLSGAQERHWQGFVCPARPGDVWLCATWEPHGWRALLPGTTDVVAVFLPGFLGDEMFGDVSWLSLFAVSPSLRPRADDPGKRSGLLALGQELLEEHQQDRPAWETAVRLNLLRLLFAVSRSWAPPPAVAPPRRVRLAHLAQVMPALRIAHSHPARRVSVAEAAAASNLSRSQFCLVFKRTMGLTFGEFSLRARLALVADRLLNTQLPTDAIAEGAGFADASHLHRNFLRRYGCTPAQYRERAQSAATVPPFGLGPQQEE